ncbi:MAG: NUDIX domain-containing protein [Alphaproteobacteria bacterium]|nr:NUDIX domain-containing protein [Alphaproteobacteria bacterium]
MPEAKDPRVKIREKKTVFQGHFRVDTYFLRHEMHEGGWSSEIKREVFERGHAAGLLGYDPDRDEVLLIEQFRIGAYVAGYASWVTEIVAGIIEEGESPEDVVRREVVEEAGLEVGELIPIADYLVSPGGTSETMALFCGRVALENAGGIHGLDHEQEDIRVLAVPRAEAAKQLQERRIKNSMTIIALQWLELNHAALQKRWA